MLDIVKLSCARGDRTLFRDLSFSVTPGQLLHVTGQNGSGKTTLLRSLCGLTRPLEGKIVWNGEETRRLGDDYRGQIAYVGHGNGIQGELTPPENLRAGVELTKSANDTDIETALKRLSLDAYHDFPAKILSQGQKRRLALTRLLIDRRPLWLLDEPLTALDTRSIAVMTDIFSEHLTNGGMIVLTSHQDLGKLAQRTVNLDA